MRDYLLDIVQHTFDLGCIDLIKITGTDSATTVGGLAEDKSVIIDAQFANPMADFVGTFGMPNLGKLKTLLNLQEYREDAKLAVTRKANGELDGITFENKVGDFKNNYRFMASDIVNDKLKTLKFKGVNWHITFEPTVAAIQRLRMQAQANSEELNFQVKTDGKDLKFFFGDHSTHSGNFVFQHDITGALKHAWSWPVSQVMSILSLTGDKTMQISDDGCMQITVNSGLAVYNYILPAQTK
ncbi:hypothetical protein [Haliscomenobacter sp.]|uniref:hypothetical protein n=1 Tax=Haliscomenobacter sp. TaxID=2717303 RepID=UPI0033652188